MDAREKEVLAALRFDVTPTERSLLTQEFHRLEGLNSDVYDRIASEIKALVKGMKDSPAGLVIHGEHGSGKSHLIGWVRKHTSAVERGYSFNIQPDGNADTLWTRVLSSMLHDLHQPLNEPDDDTMPVTQLTQFIGRLADGLGMSPAAARVLSGRVRVEGDQAMAHVKDLTDRLRRTYPGPQPRNVARALALTAIQDDDANAAGMAYFRATADEQASRTVWGLRPIEPGPAREIVRDMSSLLAMTGPSVFVVDQIDNLIERSAASTEHATTETNDLAARLMEIREKLARSITIISCLEHTWQNIAARATISARDRFHDALSLKPIPSADVAHRLVARFLHDQYQELGHTPRFDSWPVPVRAFESAVSYRPRRLMQATDTFVRQCVEAGELLELTDFADFDTTVTTEPKTDDATQPVQDRFLHHQRQVELDALKANTNENQLATLLYTAVQAYMVEAKLEDHKVIDTSNGAPTPSVHCEVSTRSGPRLCVRGINYVVARAVGNRLDAAKEYAEAGPDGAARLLIVRTNPWKPTRRIRQASAQVHAIGGVIVEISDEDLRSLRAVELTADGHGDTERWLRQHRPVSATGVGRQLAKILGETTPETPQPNGDKESSEAVESTAVFPGPEAVLLGVDDEGSSVNVGLEALSKHVAVFASSGSGKTVLLRRLIEECASRGVGTIVLDPNNDLARLGDPWPRDPEGWWHGDAARSGEYLNNTDVVVWTPGVSKGNPLTLRAFPDFAAVRDDADDLRRAVEIAVASLAPRARIDGNTHQADGRQAVLRKTLTQFALYGDGSFDQLIDMLNHPVEAVLDLPDATKHARFVASALSYARSNDALFEGDGTVFDPGRLLTPANGNRARVSVINLAGIPDPNRPAFVNRLQMALFSWIKQNPARDRPLSGLFIMDEAQTFIPSGQSTPCTESTRNLASQARKYGLGLVYATQAPRGIDSRITGNAATHLYGRVVVPAHVGAVNEIARARGEQAPPVSQLSKGRFYASLEGRPLTHINAPLCLSHHGSPLEEPEIVERAARTTG